MGNETTEIMKERNITVKLSDEDCISLVEKCGRCGLTVGELLENFIEDLVGSAQSNGYDEMVNAGHWFERSSFAIYPEPTLLNHLLKWEYDPEDYLDTMDDLKEAEKEKEYAIGHPEEYDVGAIEFIDDSIADYRQSLEDMRDGWKPNGEPDMEQEIETIRKWVTEKEDFMNQTNENSIQETSENQNISAEELNRVIDDIYDKSEEEMISLARSIKSGENTRPIVQKALESVLRIRIDELQEANKEYYGKGQIDESMLQPDPEDRAILEELRHDMWYDGPLTGDEVGKKMVFHDEWDPSMLSEPASKERMQMLENDGYIQSVGENQYQWTDRSKTWFSLDYKRAVSSRIANIYQKYELEGVGKNFRNEVEQMLSTGKSDFLQNDIQKFVDVAQNVGNTPMLRDFKYAAEMLSDYQKNFQQWAGELSQRATVEADSVRTDDYRKFLHTEEITNESDMYRLLHNNGYTKLAYPTVTSEGGVFQRAAGASDQQVMEAYGKIKSDMANMVRQSGFKPSNHMLKNVMKINMIAGKNYTMESLSQLYRESRSMELDNAMKNIANEVGKEFAGQEMAQKTAAALPEAVM